MKRIFTLCLAVCITMAGFAQVDTTQKQKADTILIGGMVIIRDNDGKNHQAEKDELPRIWNRKNDEPANISTNWWIFDIGFSNYNDNTDYLSAETQAYAPGSNETWFETKYGKSRSVNIWVFMQRINIIKHAVNFKYGVGLELNNYFYKQPVRYIETPEPIVDPPRVFLDNNKEYKKVKLAADYLTVPIMLNFNFTPKRDRGYGFSAGISVGYLYSARNKFKTTDGAIEKEKDDFELDRWKLSYVAEISLGIIRFYGSYAFKSMYERGLDMTPYTFGFRFSNW